MSITQDVKFLNNDVKFLFQISTHKYLCVSRFKINFKL